ncbi:MAG: tRNA 4-thiouridine(8) synthase ThiI [candidate division WOR-3 bacterium]|nr:tRNA 4-thiouridine(8) synthase ThiI [candidate division WOR-3 bacterium]
MQNSNAQKQLTGIGLLSGGLDSILALHLVNSLNIKVVAVCFVSPFFDNSHRARAIAQELNIDLRIIWFGDEYIKLIQHPKFGYGKNLNPCIDCHIYMLKKSKELMESIGADFVFTGEVLGERPMSQNRQSLKLIEREAGLTGRLLRPLSAQLLEPTILETQGLIDRSRLLNIQGRSRKTQLLLARQYNIKDIPQPAGGCLLTDSQFSKRLRDALFYNEVSLNDIELLKFGRHFRVRSLENEQLPPLKIIVGRDEKENQQLLQLKMPDDLVLQPLDVPGPVVLIRNPNQINIIHNEKILSLAAGICARYSDNQGQPVKISVAEKIILTQPLNNKMFDNMKI